MRNLVPELSWEALREFFEQMARLVAGLTTPELLQSFLLSQFERLQRVGKINDPYSLEEEPLRHNLYLKQWLGGYVGTSIIVGVATLLAPIPGARIGKFLQGSRRATKLLRLLQSTRVGRALRAVETPSGLRHATAVLRVLAKRDSGGGVLLRTPRSVGATYRLWQLDRKADIPGDLDAADQRELARFFLRTGSEGARLARGLDAGELRQLFATARTLDPNVRTEWYRLLRNSDLSPGEAASHVRHLAKLEGPETRRLAHRPGTGPRQRRRRRSRRHRRGRMCHPHLRGRRGRRRFGEERRSPGERERHRASDGLRDLPRRARR